MSAVASARRPSVGSDGPAPRDLDSACARPFCVRPPCRPPSASAVEHELLFADDQVAPLEHLRHDVGALLDLEIDEVGRSIADFIERWKLRGAGAYVCELAVVVDGRDQE